MVPTQRPAMKGILASTIKTNQFCVCVYLYRIGHGPSQDASDNQEYYMFNTGFL